MVKAHNLVTNYSKITIEKIFFHFLDAQDDGTPTRDENPIKKSKLKSGQVFTSGDKKSAKNLKDCGNGKKNASSSSSSGSSSSSDSSDSSDELTSSRRRKWKPNAASKKPKIEINLSASKKLIKNAVTAALGDAVASTNKEKLLPATSGG